MAKGNNENRCRNEHDKEQIYVCDVFVLAKKVACSVQWNARHCMKCSVSPRVAIAAAAAAATVAASDHFSWL